MHFIHIQKLISFVILTENSTYFAEKSEKQQICSKKIY